MAGGVSNCESATCCTHPTESERLLKRDGVLYVVCVECGTEMGTSVPDLVSRATPCGSDYVNPDVPNMSDYVNTDIPNPWGGKL